MSCGTVNITEITIFISLVTMIFTLYLSRKVFAHIFQAIFLRKKVQDTEGSRNIYCY
jgi:uncharacterized membrane protein YjjP (DUF1212 family)